VARESTAMTGLFLLDCITELLIELGWAGVLEPVERSLQLLRGGGRLHVEVGHLERASLVRISGEVEEPAVTI